MRTCICGNDSAYGLRMIAILSIVLWALLWSSSQAFAGSSRQISVSPYPLQDEDRATSVLHNRWISDNGTVEKIGQIGEYMNVTATAIDGYGFLYYGNGSELVRVRMVEGYRLQFVERLGNFPGPILDMDVVGQILYLLVAPESTKAIEGKELWVIDTADPDTMVLLAKTPVVNVTSITATDDFIYTIGASFVILDMSDPLHEVVVGSLPLGDYVGGDVVVTGSSAYYPGYKGFGMIDISDPTLPRIMGKFDGLEWETVSLAAFSHNVFAGDYTGKLYNIDVSDPANPVEIEHIQASRGYGDMRLASSLTYLYIWSGRRLATYGLAESQALQRLSDQAVSWNLARNVTEIRVDEGFLSVSAQELGLYIYSLADPTAPLQVSSNLSEPLEAPVNIAAHGEWVYRLNQKHVDVISIHDPLQPEIKSRISLDGYGQGLWLSTNRLYVATGPRELSIFSLATPDRPTLLGKHPLPEGWVMIEPSENVLYIVGQGAERWIQNLMVVDLADVTAPVLADTIPFDGILEGISALSASGGFLFVGSDDYFDQETESIYQKLEIFDISESIIPRKISEYSMGVILARDVALYNNLALVQLNSGLLLLDIADPTKPLRVSDEYVPGETIVHVQDGLIFLEEDDTFYVIDIRNPAQPALFDRGQNRGWLDIAVSYPYVLGSHLGGMDVLYFSLPESIDVTTAEQEVTVSNGIRYSFPTGTVTETHPFQHISRFPYIPSMAETQISLGLEFELRSTGGLTQTRIPFSVTLPFSENGSVDIQPASMGIFRRVESEWVKEPTSQLDEEGKSVSFNTDLPGRWALLAEKRVISQSHDVFLPAIIRPNIDLFVKKLELTQAVQNEDMRVPMVAQRPTLLRVYVATSGLTPVDDITVSLNAYRDGLPLEPEPIVLGPGAAFPSSNPFNLSHSFNTLLPESWLTGQIDLEITIDTKGKVQESDETNNHVNQLIVFHSVPPLDLTIVPIEYNYNGTHFPPVTQDTISEWVLRSYPLHQINVQLHTPISLTIAPSQEIVVQMYQAVSSVKQAEGALYSHVYYGLGSVTNSAGFTYFPSGLIGYGGARLGAGLNTSEFFGGDESGILAAHEIGHGLGRGHTFSDPQYPYPDDSIGQYGVDISRMQLWRPGLPDLARDFMSYSGPEWVSDYTYLGLYNAQIRDGALAAAMTSARTLMVRATLKDEVSAEIQPLYVIPAPVSTFASESDYVVELVMGERVVSTHPVSILHAVGRDDSLAFVSANLEMPSTDFNRVRIMHRDKEIAAREMSITSNPSLSFWVNRTESRVTISWDPPGQPVLIRYTLDEGASWTTLGVDSVGGRYSLDESALPGGTLAFQVIPSDVVRPAADLVAFRSSIDSHPPELWISGPDSLDSGQPLLLFGHAVDREDGVLQGLNWTIDGNTVEASQILQIQSLAPGKHFIQVTARDSSGKESTSTHVVTAE